MHRFELGMSRVTRGPGSPSKISNPGVEIVTPGPRGIMRRKNEKM